MSSDFSLNGDGRSDDLTAAGPLLISLDTGIGLQVTARAANTTVRIGKRNESQLDGGSVKMRLSNINLTNGMMVFLQPWYSNTGFPDAFCATVVYKSNDELVFRVRRVDANGQGWDVDLHVDIFILDPTVKN